MNYVHAMFIAITCKQGIELALAEEISLLPDVAGTIVPLVHERRYPKHVKSRDGVIVVAPRLPTYVFVKMHEFDLWPLLREVEDVRGFVMIADIPLKLRDNVIWDLAEDVNEEFGEICDNDIVMIADGPLKGVIGKYHDGELIMDDRMGQEIRVKVHVSSLRLLSY